MTGSNFGGDARNVRTVSYGPSSTGSVQYAMTCVPSPITSTTTLTCTTGPGVGGEDVQFLATPSALLARFGARG